MTEDQRPPGDGREGDRIPGVPDWTFSASVRKEGFIGSNLEYFVNLGCQHVGSSFNGFGTSTGTSGSSAERQDGYDVVRVRSGLSGTKWQMTVHVDNLSDERAVLFLNRIVGDVRVNTIAPRTIGISHSRSVVFD